VRPSRPDPSDHVAGLYRSFGDVSPALYGGDHHDDLYDIDPLQDAFDVAVAAWTQHTRRPMEAVETDPADRQWFLGVQWHPEDTADTDPSQQALFSGLVHAAARVASAR
jgi:putative glutamine amidotransferase